MTARAAYTEGWITVPYDGIDTALVEIGVNGDYKAAFLDWADGQRVAKLRPATFGNPAGQLGLELRVNGSVTWQGLLVV